MNRSDLIHTGTGGWLRNDIYMYYYIEIKFQEEKNYSTDNIKEPKLRFQSVSYSIHNYSTIINL